MRSISIPWPKVTNGSPAASPFEFLIIGLNKKNCKIFHIIESIFTIIIYFIVIITKNIDDILLPEEIGFFHNITGNAFQRNMHGRIWSLMARSKGGKTKDCPSPRPPPVTQCLMLDWVAQLYLPVEKVQPLEPQTRTCSDQAKSEGQEPDLLLFSSSSWLLLRFRQLDYQRERVPTLGLC